MSPSVSDGLGGAFLWEAIRALPNTRLSARLPVGKQAHKSQGVKDEEEEEEDGEN